MRSDVLLHKTRKSTQQRNQNCIFVLDIELADNTRNNNKKTRQASHNSDNELTLKFFFLCFVHSLTLG